MTSFLKYSAAALVTGILLGMAFAAAYGYGYRHGVDDTVQAIENVLSKTLWGPLRREPHKPQITVEEVPQK